FASLGEFAIYDELGNFLPTYTGLAGDPIQNGDASGFAATMTENTATITLDVFEDGETEGVQRYTYELLDGEIYGVSARASEATIRIDDSDSSGGQFLSTGANLLNFDASQLSA
ncbi:hypothetical protein GLO73106DRAFT_00033860, partial [Gloeocapsa sp. PCC 73106]